MIVEQEIIKLQNQIYGLRRHALVNDIVFGALILLLAILI